MSLNVFVLFLSTVVLCVTPIYYQRKRRPQEQPLDYRNLEELLDYFRKDTSEIARKILETFQNYCYYSFRKERQEEARKPFIVIEGNHKLSRTRVGRRLAKMIKGWYLDHPAPCIKKYLNVLPRSPIFRRAFFHLSNYASSLYAKANFNRTIIMNGFVKKGFCREYWTEQLVFTIAHKFPTGDLPNITSEIFRAPEDLLQPDLIFYLELPDIHPLSSSSTWHPQAWKLRTIHVVRQLQNTNPIVIKEVKPVLKCTAEELYLYIYEHLRHRLFTSSQYSTNSTIN